MQNAKYLTSSKCSVEAIVILSSCSLNRAQFNCRSLFWEQDMRAGDLKQRDLFRNRNWSVILYKMSPLPL